MKPSHIKALAWAVDEAECLRGSLIGSGSDLESQEMEADRLASFDAKIAVCKTALRELRREAKEKPKPTHVAH